MSDKCSWPGCRAFYTGVYEKKPLCDVHTAEVMQEGRRGDVARKKLGLRPIPVIHGVLIRGQAPCSVCGARAFYLVDGVIPVCAQHMAPGDKLKGMKRVDPAALKPERSEPKQEPEPEPEPELSSWAARLANGEFD